jgi:hypothetical protein
MYGYVNATMDLQAAPDLLVVFTNTLSGRISIGCVPGSGGWIRQRDALYTFKRECPAHLLLFKIVIVWISKYNIKEDVAKFDITLVCSES